MSRLRPNMQTCRVYPSIDRRYGMLEIVNGPHRGLMQNSKNLTQIGVRVPARAQRVKITVRAAPRGRWWVGRQDSMKPVYRWASVSRTMARGVRPPVTANWAYFCYLPRRYGGKRVSIEIRKVAA